MCDALRVVFDLQAVVQTTSDFLSSHRQFMACFNTMLVHPLCQLMHAESGLEKSIAVQLMNAFMNAAHKKQALELFSPYFQDYIKALVHFLGTDDPEVLSDAQTFALICPPCPHLLAHPFCAVSHMFPFVPLSPIVSY